MNSPFRPRAKRWLFCGQYVSNRRGSFLPCFAKLSITLPFCFEMGEKPAFRRSGAILFFLFLGILKQVGFFFFLGTSVHGQSPAGFSPPFCDVEGSGHALLLYLFSLKDSPFLVNSTSLFLPLPFRYRERVSSDPRLWCGIPPSAPPSFSPPARNFTTPSCGPWKTGALSPDLHNSRFP